MGLALGPLWRSAIDFRPPFGQRSWTTYSAFSRFMDDHFDYQSHLCRRRNIMATDLVLCDQLLPIDVPNLSLPISDHFTFC